MLSAMAQQDQQLINNLIQQQNTSAYAQEIAQEAQSNITENQMVISRVVTAKYKVYVIILLILLAILGMNLAPQARKEFTQAQSSFASSQSWLVNLDEKLKTIGENKKLWKLTENTQQQIIACINDDEGCENLDPTVNQHLKAARSYLQLGTLKSEKMEINEKKILKNLDQYLIRHNPSETSSARNGEILSIEIGSGKLIDETSQFFQTPIVVKVVFNSKDDLVSFVDNIEKYIISEPEDRILYHIEEVSYDMMAYDESQETELKLNAYYFK